MAFQKAWRSKRRVFDPSAITIISGGQTGADRAALDFAIEHNIAHGGWCPRGRLAEDGPIPARYELRETPSRRYSQRTEWNVRDSHATIVFTIAPAASGGTSLTLACARRLGKPLLHLSRDEIAASFGNDDAIAAAAAAQLLAFLEAHDIYIFDVAGPRESQEPEIGDFVHSVLTQALAGTTHC
jgi:hypothetical protein